MQKNRLDFVDLAKGIGMLMVIYLHITINYPKSTNIYEGSHWDIFVHSMFMPIFFILSGFFFSIKLDCKEWLTKKCKRLIIPFIIFYTLTYLINVVLTTFCGIKLKSGFSYWDIFVVFHKDVYPNSAVWFLLALFWSSLVLYFILKKFNNLIIQSIFVIATFIIGISLDKYNINIPLYVDTALSATIFVFTGYLIKHFNLLEKLKRLPLNRQRFLIVTITIISFCICWIFGEGASMVNNKCGNPIIFYFMGVAGSLSVISFSYILKSLPLVSYIGRYSMLVLCTHMYLTNLFTRILLKFELSFLFSSIIALFAVCLCYYFIVPIAKKTPILKDVLL